MRKITLIRASEVKTQAPPTRLVAAEDFKAAPVGTVVEFESEQGKLGYKNWDHRWEVSTDTKPHDWDSRVMPDQDGPAAVLRWGQDSTLTRKAIS